MGFLDSLRKMFGGKDRAEPLECVACGTTEVTLLAPGAYRCELCGYEGGDGYAAYREGQVLERARQLDDQALLEQVRTGLESARLSIVATTGGGGMSEGWHIALEVGGIVLGGGVAAASHIAAEELAQRRLERERLLLQARADLLGLRPFIAVLAERGRPVQEMANGLASLAASDAPNPVGMGRLIELIGNGLLAGRG